MHSISLRIIIILGQYIMIIRSSYLQAYRRLRHNYDCAVAWLQILNRHWFGTFTAYMSI